MYYYALLRNDKGEQKIEKYETIWDIISITVSETYLKEWDFIARIVPADNGSFTIKTVYVGIPRMFDDKWRLYTDATGTIWRIVRHNSLKWGVDNIKVEDGYYTTVIWEYPIIFGTLKTAKEFVNTQLKRIEEECEDPTV